MEIFHLIIHVLVCLSIWGLCKWYYAIDKKEAIRDIRQVEFRRNQLIDDDVRALKVELDRVRGELVNVEKERDALAREKDVLEKRYERSKLDYEDLKKDVRAKVDLIHEAVVQQFKTLKEEHEHDLEMNNCFWSGRMAENAKQYSDVIDKLRKENGQFAKKTDTVMEYY